MLRSRNALEDLVVCVAASVARRDQYYDDPISRPLKTLGDHETLLCSRQLEGLMM